MIKPKTHQTMNDTLREEKLERMKAAVRAAAMRVDLQAVAMRADLQAAALEAEKRARDLKRMKAALRAAARRAELQAVALKAEKRARDLSRVRHAAKQSRKLQYACIFMLLLLLYLAFRLHQEKARTIQCFDEVNEAWVDALESRVDALESMTSHCMPE